MCERSVIDKGLMRCAEVVGGTGGGCHVTALIQ